MDELQPGVFPVAEMRPEHSVEVHEMLVYEVDDDGVNMGSCWL